jgi:hypothetical protein
MNAITKMTTNVKPIQIKGFPMSRVYEAQSKKVSRGQRTPVWPADQSSVLHSDYAQHCEHHL